VSHHLQGGLTEIEWIDLPMFYEDKPTKVGYFTNARGHADGNAAWGYARAMGQPLGSGSYFTVDYDAQAGDLAAVTSYFQGVKGALTTAAGGGQGVRDRRVWQRQSLRCDQEDAGACDLLLPGGVYRLGRIQDL
jgi:hypothetical protein